MFRHAPEARKTAIIGASGGRALRHSCSQMDALGRLQRQREVGVFVQVALSLFRQQEGAHPGEFPSALENWKGYALARGQVGKSSLRGMQ
jgi:hypothetical protein